MIRRALIALLLSPPLAATEPLPDHCSCLWEGSFAEVAPNTDLVIHGRVVSRKGNAVDFYPVEQYLGNTWLDRVRVWMRTAHYCRPDATGFDPGSEWVLALRQIREVPEDGFNPSTPNHSYGRKLDYQLSGCGGYWLEVRGDTVVGNLVPDMPRWDHEPDMTPVLKALIAAYLDGRAGLAELKDAATEDPALKALMLDTKSFLRGQEAYLEEGSGESDTP